MRKTFSIVMGALLLASGLAAAQDGTQTVQPVKPQPPAAASGAPAMTTPWTASLDFGYRGTDISGDFARYDRYGDLREGAASKFLFTGTSDRYLFRASMGNVGYRDQNYQVEYAGAGVKGNFTFDSTPLNYSYIASTPWQQESPGVFTLNAAARLAVQNKTASGIPSNAAQLATPSIYRGLAGSFDLQQRRDTTAFALGVDRGPLGAQFSFQSAKKSGTLPWDASFAFNNANELALPLDSRTNDFGANLEWATHKGMVRVGWTGSWFDNRIQTLVWDNPLRATDFNNGLAITNPPCQTGVPMGPYDCSGYSNGNGPAQGRMSLAPSNNMNTFSTTGLYKMPYRSTLNGTFAFTLLKQNEALIPWTINPVIANPAVYAVFPGLASLERPTAEAEVRGINALVNFTSRPSRYFDVNARFRHNRHENRTPVFDAVEYVRFDAVPEETGGETEPFNIDRNTFDLNATFHLARHSALRVGYGYDAYDRTGRSFESITDHTVRTSIDTFSNRFVTVRGIYEHVFRRGSGLSVDAITDTGSQPALRFYDEAQRDRDRGTLVVVFTPVAGVDVSGMFAGGKDDYNAQDQRFGLLNNTNTSLNVGVGLTPVEKVAFGVNYGRDEYRSLQRSRNANPLPDLQFNDATRDWTLNNNERVNTFDLYCDVRRAFPRTDVSVNYNYSDSDNAFIHGGPRIDALIAVGQFQALPNVTNTWQRLTAEVKYFFAPKVGVGAGWWYEKLEVSDFATIDLPGQAGTPRIDYLGEINTGYGNRPYKGNTGFLRLLVLF